MSLRPSSIASALRDVGDNRLLHFMQGYFSISGDAIRLRPPQDNMLRVDGVFCVILYRQDQFQVELVCVDPETDIPDHTHPDVESYEVALSGGIELFVGGMQSTFFRQARADGVSRDLCKYVPIPHDQPHGGRTGAQGASFLSVQLWRDGLDPTFILRNWQGAHMGDKHKELNA